MSIKNVLNISSARLITITNGKTFAGQAPNPYIVGGGADFYLEVQVRAETGRAGSLSKGQGGRKVLFYNDSSHSSAFEIVMDAILEMKETKTDAEKATFGVPQLRDAAPSILMPKGVQINGYATVHELPKGQYYETTYEGSVKRHQDVRVVCIGEAPESTKDGIMINTPWGETPRSVFQSMVNGNIIEVKHFEAGTADLIDLSGDAPVEDTPPAPVV